MMENESVIILRHTMQELWVNLTYLSTVILVMSVLLPALLLRPLMEARGMYRWWRPWLAIVPLVLTPGCIGLLRLLLLDDGYVLAQAPTITLNLLMVGLLLLVLAGGLWTVIRERSSRYR